MKKANIKIEVKTPAEGDYATQIRHFVGYPQVVAGTLMIWKDDQSINSTLVASFATGVWMSMTTSNYVESEEGETDA